MELSPEERRKIYEEEKARIEAEEQPERDKTKPDQETTVDLPANVAGLLCYLAGWITGIIFFVIEKKNVQVRFHAAQSIVLFGFLFIVGLLLGWIPIFGDIIKVILGITGFILWIVLMVKAYNGESYKVFIAGDIAESMAGTTGETGSYQAPPKPRTQEETPPIAAETDSDKSWSGSLADTGKRIEKEIDDFFDKKRAGVITGSAFAIAWSIIVLIFFNFFNEYAAYYNADTVGGATVWTRTPFFTNDITLWLPVLNTALAVAILGHIIIIAIDSNILRRILRIIIDIFGLGAVITLVTVFPFDFNVIPNTTTAAGVEVGVIVILVCIAVGMGISVIVRFIKLLADAVNKAKRTNEIA